MLNHAIASSSRIVRFQTILHKRFLADGVWKYTLALCIALMWWGFRTFQGLFFIEFGDETMRFTVVQQMEAGARLYRDAIDHQGPGTFFLAWVFHALGAETIPQYRAATALIDLAAIAALLFSPAWRRPKSAVIATIIYAAILGTLEIGWTGQMLMYQPVGGSLVVLAFCLSLFPMLLGVRPKAWQMIAAGAAWALALWAAISFLISAILFGLLIIIAAMWHFGRRLMLILAGQYLIGGIAAFAVFAVWTTFWSDWIGLYAYHIYFNTEFYAGYTNIHALAPFRIHQNFTLETVNSQGFLTLIMLALAYAGAIMIAITISGNQSKRIKSAGRAFVGVVAATSLIITTYYLDLRGGDHWHAAALFQFGLVLFASGIGLFSVGKRGMQMAAAALIGFAATSSIIAYYNVRTLNELAITLARVNQEPSINTRYDTPFESAIRAVTGPDETILAYPYFPAVYYFSQRRSASPHINFLPWQHDYIQRPFADMNFDPCEDIERNNPAALFLSDGPVWGRYDFRDYAACIFDYAEIHMVQITDGDRLIYVRDDIAEEIAQRMGVVLTEPSPEQASEPPQLVAAGPIYSGHGLRQEIEVPEGVQATEFAILFATYARRNPGTVIVRLLRGDETIFETRFEAADLTDNSYRYFAVSSGLTPGRYDLLIETTNENPDQAITVWLHPTQQALVQIGHELREYGICLVWRHVDGVAQHTHGCPLG